MVHCSVVCDKRDISKGSNVATCWRSVRHECESRMDNKDKGDEMLAKEYS